MTPTRPDPPGDASDPRPLGDPAVIRQQQEEGDMALGSTASGHADTDRHVAATRELLELRDWLRDWREDDAAGLYEIISILDDAEGKLERAAAALAAAEETQAQEIARLTKARDEIQRVYVKSAELAVDEHARALNAEQERDTLAAALAAAEQGRQEAEQEIVTLKRAIDGHRHAAIIARALSQIERSYELSEVGPDNGGFSSKLENYIHQIWKREPKVDAAEARVRELEQVREALFNLTTRCTCDSGECTYHRAARELLASLPAVPVEPNT